MRPAFTERELPAQGEAALAKNSVDAWYASLPLDRDPSGSELGILSAEERNHASRMGKEPRRRFAGSRLLLRRLLAAYLGANPEDIELAYRQHGKPELAGRLAGAGIHFNYSHSGDRALFAFSQSILGADLERLRPVRNSLALAKRYFTPSEVKSLSAVPEADRQSAFLDQWTCKEAYAKALGKGIATPLSAFAIAFPQPGQPAVLGPAGAPDPSWTLWLLQPEPGMTGAVATQSSRPSIRCWALATA